MEPLFSFAGDLDLARFLDTTSSRIIVTSQRHGSIVLNSDGEYEGFIDTAQGEATSVLGAQCTENIYAILHGSNFPNETFRNLRVRLFDLQTGNATHNVAAPTGQIYGGIALVERPERSAVLVTGSNTGAVLVWNLDSGSSTPTWVLSGHTGSIFDVKIYNGYIISHGEDGTVRVWNLDSGACLHILGGHSVWTCSEFLDLRRMATLDNEGLLRIWSLDDGSCSIKLERYSLERFSALSCTPRRLISRDNGGAIYIWNRRTWTLDCAVRAHNSHCISAIWTGNGEAMVTVGFDGRLRVWDFENATTAPRNITPLLDVPVDGIRSMKRIGRRLATLSLPEESTASATKFRVHIWDINQVDRWVEDARAVAVSPLLLNAPAGFNHS